MPIRIAIDVMGGDSGPRLCISAALKFHALHPDVHLILVGSRHLISASNISLPSQIEIRPAEEHVDMSDRPGTALRHKQDSSMAIAVQMVADAEVQACVSAGNTGALMAFGLHLLGTMRGIERPAICKPVPTRNGSCWVLDLGANLDCSAEHLRQFAVMGAALARVGGVSEPRVALLNVGVESHKGKALQQECAALLQAQPGFRYVGFIEGGDIFRGATDVVVCDGFTGNVLLKTSEGVAELLQASLRDAFQRNLSARVAAWAASSVLQGWIRRYDPARLNGASLLGLNGIVVKSHGAASEDAFLAALNVAYEQVVNRIIDGIAATIQ